MDDSNDNLFIAGWQEPYQLTRGALCHVNKPITLSPHSGAGQRSWQDKAFTTRRLSAGCLFWTYLTLNGRILNISFLQKETLFMLEMTVSFDHLTVKLIWGVFRFGKIAETNRNKSDTATRKDFGGCLATHKMLMYKKFLSLSRVVCILGFPEL